jgi:hypothetical protein
MRAPTTPRRGPSVTAAASTRGSATIDFGYHPIQRVDADPDPDRERRPP